MGAIALLVGSIARASEDLKGGKGIDVGPNKRMWALTALKYVQKNEAKCKAKKIRGFQRILGAVTTGKPDNGLRRAIEKVLGYKVKWPDVAGKARRKRVDKIKKAIVKLRPIGLPEGFKGPVTKKKHATAKAAAKPPARRATRRSAVTQAAPATPKKKSLVLSSATSEPVRDIIKALVPAVKFAAPQRKAKLPKRTARPAAKPRPKTTPATAANALDKYLRSGGYNRAMVKALQGRMGGIAADGVAGPKTRARAEELLGRKLHWPQIDAATELRTYYKQGGRNKAKIKGWQRAMGEIDVDGLVGPQTRKRYTGITGQRW